ncbi:response regulator [Candidatus Venteria ishoeyi]|uniref:hybrid sensor histidine kinase/response regulator n=1 Tax=Candidatus Venteria ishoeyi TaxID=1899563 RepID=UPI0025A5A51E|nr:response regulator [Candidatus Venteria ishoeyi]MDM8546053.1 response regulator [Candidatus Venteria ishoeyi]
MKFTQYILHHLNTRFPVFSGFIIVALLLIGLIFLGLDRIEKINTHLLAVINQHHQKSELVHRLNFLVSQRVLTLYAMSMTDDFFLRDDLFQQYHMLAGKFIATRRQLERMPLTFVEHRQLDRSRLSTQRYSSIRNQIAQLLVENRDTEALLLIQEQKISLHEHSLDGLTELLAFQEQAMENERKAAGLAYEEARWLFGGAGIMALVLSLLIGFMIFRYIRKNELNLQAEKEQALALVDSHEESLDEANAALAQRNQELSHLNQNLQQTIADLHKAKVAAESASHLKGAFLANMSHEIRTPLNAVIGMSDLLLDTQLNAIQQDYTDTIHSSSEALLSLINDILDFSKIEAGKLELEQSSFNLYAVVENALDLITERAMQKNLELLGRIADNTPASAFGDASRLRQILVNLLSNAVKFTQQGEVIVDVSYRRLSAELSEFEFIVSDTGSGISVEKIENLFTPFTQLDSSTTRRFGGTGLGLTISRELVELMDGQIRVESEPGQGSRFIFSIHLKPHYPPPAWLNKALLPEGSATQRVFLVESHLATQQWLEQHLLQWGLQIESQGDPEAAYAYLAQQPVCPFDLIIINMELSQGNGLILCQHLREQANCKNVPILLMVSLGSMAWKDEENQDLFNAYVHKPLKLKSLHQSLKALLSDTALATEDVLKTNIPPAAEKAQEETKADIKTLSILMAEDNPLNQKVALLLLNKLGYAVHIVNNGLEAVTALQAKTYDAVLMDMQMPKMDGMTATAEIRKLAIKQPYIIALTAHAMQGYKEECLQAGMDDYVSKPVRKNELAAALQRASAY